MSSSLFARLCWLIALLLCGQALLFACAIYLEAPLAYSLLASLSLLLLLPLLVQRLLKPLHQVTEAMALGINALNDKDFSITIAQTGYREFSDIITTFNQLVTLLRAERMTIFQRELMLDTVIQSSPVALFLTDQRNHVVYSNLAARTLVNHSGKLEGLAFFALIKAMPKNLYQASKQQQSGLFTEQVNQQTLIYQLNCQQFQLRGSMHKLYTYKNMTPEIARKEHDIWKQVIRLISHELNNSLAPISSLSHSAQQIVNAKTQLDLLPEILATISRRTEHLHQFISQYAQFAKLPQPKLEPVILSAFVEQINRLCHVDIQVETSVTMGCFDASQIEQVLINLLKNARESGSDEAEITLQLTEQNQQLKFTLSDRGKGMSTTQLEQAMLPFFTTKATGTGVGLALSRDIVSAHGGQLQLHNRPQGGLTVKLSLPNKFAKLAVN